MASLCKLSRRSCQRRPPQPASRLQAVRTLPRTPLPPLQGKALRMELGLFMLHRVLFVQSPTHAAYAQGKRPRQLSWRRLKKCRSNVRHWVRLALAASGWEQRCPADPGAERLEPVDLTDAAARRAWRALSRQLLRVHKRLLRSSGQSSTCNNAQEHACQVFFLLA